MRTMTIVFTVGLLLLPALFGASSADAQADDTLPPTIITFTGVLDVSDYKTITVNDADAGNTPLTLSWYVVGLDETHRLRLQVYDVNTWRTLLPDLDTDTLPADGTHILMVKHPANFSAPSYRLAIVDADDRLVDAHIITIPYTWPVANGAPSFIQTFSADLESLDVKALQSGSAQITVRWDVACRAPTSNLIFEQVPSEGRAFSIEQPRDHLWVASAGQGTVIIRPPVDNNTPITLRLRLIDLQDGAILDVKTVSLDVDVSHASITSFVAKPNTVNATTLAQGDARVAVHWEVVNRPEGSNLVFEQVLANGDTVSVELPRPDPIIPSVGEGTVVPVLPPNNADSIVLRLRLVDIADVRVVYDEVTVELRIASPIPSAAPVTPTPAQSSIGQDCPYDYFFTPLEDELPCPVVEVKSVQAAFQAFEGGYMIWRSDYKRIYVLATRSYPRLDAYLDTWIDGDVIDIDDAPPSGRYQPERGFGKVWAEHRSVRDALGWATTPEQGYIMNIQTSAMSYDTRIYLTWPVDARIIALFEGTWKFVGEAE